MYVNAHFRVPRSRIHKKFKLYVQNTYKLKAGDLDLVVTDG